jgi:hypothetical protein
MPGWYSRIDSTKLPASGAGNVSEPRLMSQVGKRREVVCCANFVCLRNSCNHVTEGGSKVSDTEVMQNDGEFVALILLHIAGK